MRIYNSNVCKQSSGETSADQLLLFIYLFSYDALVTLIASSREPLSFSGSLQKLNFFFFIVHFISLYGEEVN